MNHSDEEITNPREKKLFTSFEPFSPILIDKLDELRDKRTKLQLFNELLNDDVFKTENISENGAKTVIHPLHKTKDKFWNQTLEMAKKLNNQGKDVIFLPEYDNETSADAFIIINGLPRIVDFKYSSATKFDTLQKQLAEGFKQTNAFVLKLENMDAGQFKNTIEYMKRNSLPLGDILLLNQYGKGIELSRRDLKFGKYRNKIKGFLK